MATALKENPTAYRINASKLAKLFGVAPSTVSRHIGEFLQHYRIEAVPIRETGHKFSTFVKVKLKDSSKHALKTTNKSIQEKFGYAAAYILPGEDGDILYLLRAEDADDATKKMFDMKNLPNVASATMSFILLDEL